MKKTEAIDPLILLFASPELVRILRYLVFNDSSSFTKDDLQKTLDLKARDATVALGQLEKSGVMKSSSRGKTKRYRIDKDHSALQALQDLLRYDYESNKRSLRKAFKQTGKITGVYFTGRLVGNNRTEIDVVVLAEEYQDKKLKKLIQNISYKTGFELTYVVMTPVDFAYRTDMNDRIVRNILDFNHYQLF